MAIEPGCNDGPNESLRKILIGINEIAEAGGGGSSGNVNLTQIAGTAVSTDCGAADAGTLRVAHATDCVVTTNATVVNGAGAAAVNIQDGGNSITVDGTVTATPSGTQDTNIIQILGAAPSATNPMPSRPTNGTAFLANLGETAATGNFVRITDGTDTALVTAAGELNTLNTNGAGAAAVNIQDGGNSITVDGTVTIGTSVTPGTGATNLGKAEDAAHVSGDTGVATWGVANVAQTTFAADGDYIPHSTDLAGNAMVVGNIASDGVDAGAPVKIGTVGRTTLPTAVADGDRVNTMGNKYGELVTVHAIREMRANQVTTITASVAETTIVTAVASFMLDLYGLIITNTSATAVNVAIKDATAGTTRMNIAVPAGDTRGFMLPASDGHKQATANNNWTATSSASVSSLVITALTKQTT